MIMNPEGRAVRIQLSDIKSPQMRAFHMSWMAFFLAFFGWFGIAPLMAVVRDELSLSKEQIGNIMIASVAITIVSRLFIGWLCDRIGPRKSYSWLLILGSLPVMGIGLADSYQSFLLFRLAIGVIGASFVITQYHTSLMFAPNCVGTANATTAGWGNLGGGVTQIIMPLLFSALLSLGANAYAGWRIAMVIPGIALLIMGFAYRFCTQDTPQGNLTDLRTSGEQPHAHEHRGAMWAAIKDHRVWALFVVYGACFGIELTINNVAALYFHDSFHLSVSQAGLIAGLFGLMNIFARTLGGVFGDRAGIRFGLRGRVAFLGITLAAEGAFLMLFARMNILPLAIVTLVLFSLFVQMAEGATFSVVPFINRRALGVVSGIVGAGGNAGAVAAGFLFRANGISTQQALFILGITVAATSILTTLVRFNEADEAATRQAIDASLQARGPTPAPAPTAGEIVPAN